MRIALVQAAGLHGDGAVVRSQRWLEQAAGLGAELLVLPSCFPPGFRRELGRLAAHHGVAAAAGTSTGAANRPGTGSRAWTETSRAGTGTELWLLDAAGELQACTDSTAVVPLNGRLISLATEDDAGSATGGTVRRTRRSVSDEGAQLLVVPGGSAGRDGWFRALARRRGSGPAVAWNGPGRSFIAAPGAGVSAEAGLFEELIFADLALSARQRTVGPSWFARRYLSEGPGTRPQAAAVGAGRGS
ncbi:carbon-nitrogen hydrolase family protein [Arthrobacter sp. CAU 1506]|uniref:carbon-nitrogen hydrolase family protein n=1 Tax=Arthrobacter sp. CAU 1506 TaxID=2560052 RepID=UPI0010ABB51B|nr:carbon-nitrogen hydrolase family protein [Arthrobacter sp. CAU 1506]TJY70075.1 carbon-nitrogen hydrolase family protein [Arthrobacter sp. CAU 1506]